MTTKDKHHKHPPLTKPIHGNYHRCEWAIYGTTCANIEKLVSKLDAALKDKFVLTYIDADHSTGLLDTKLRFGNKIIRQSHFLEQNNYDDKLSKIKSDAVLVNGNHFPATRQIVVIDLNKKDSLYRRLDQLTNIDIILLKDTNEEIHNFLKNKISDETLIGTLDNLEATIAYIRSSILDSTPNVKALILAGGKSKRMGIDKSTIAYHDNISHPIYLAEKCKQLGMEVFISKQHDFKKKKVDEISVIKDRMVNMGPFGAIISAFIFDPDSAWLVLACDLPFLDEDTINRLIKQRQPSRVATAFRGKDKPFPEPLIAIYEPKAYSRFLEFLSLGYACPRKVLINSDVHIIGLEDNRIISNANSPEDRDRALAEINPIP